MANGIWKKADIITDLNAMYVGVGTPAQPIIGRDADGNPIPEGEINGVKKYIVNVNEVGKSQQNQKPTGYRKNITFYVYHEGLPDEYAWYERIEPTNDSNTDVTISSSSYQAIAKLYNSTSLRERVLAAIGMQCSSVFQESVSSTSSLTIGTGSKSLTVSTGYPAGTVQYNVGIQVSITNNGSNSMTGNVTSYNPSTGALVVNVTSVTGSGTFLSWTVVPTNHANRMKLVSQSSVDPDSVVKRLMFAIALNPTVQANGTKVTDAVIQSIVLGSWDSYASLIVA